MIQEILLDTYTIALPVVLGYIVWLLKRTNKKCIQDTNFSLEEYPQAWEEVPSQLAGTQSMILQEE